MRVNVLLGGGDGDVPGEEEVLDLDKGLVDDVVLVRKWPLENQSTPIHLYQKKENVAIAC